MNERWMSPVHPWTWPRLQHLPPPARHAHTVAGHINAWRFQHTKSYFCMAETNQMVAAPSGWAQALFFFLHCMHICSLMSLCVLICHAFSFYIFSVFFPNNFFKNSITLTFFIFRQLGWQTSGPHMPNIENFSL